eukprot:TRINITY_DN16472_c0_g1_i6.p1 TRINITY_DN16472_c0_g1~~TRINITY_DN16472_c0_g1_i6.p1  ORF type:complete len:1034 (+),score=193.65 TRINITY_DN16472_c0_g1_i6:274-3375(+)
MPLEARESKRRRSSLTLAPKSNDSPQNSPRAVITLSLSHRPYGTIQNGKFQLAPPSAEGEATDSSAAGANEEQQPLSVVRLTELVDGLEESHPEWTSTAEFHHPELVRIITEHVHSHLEHALQTQDLVSEEEVDGMMQDDVTRLFARQLLLLNSKDQILTLAVLSLDLQDEDAVGLAGAMIGFYDHREQLEVLLRAAVMQEIRGRGPSLDLFRESVHEGMVGVPTAIMSICLQVHLDKYVVSVLWPVVQKAAWLEKNGGGLNLDQADSHGQAGCGDAVANMLHCIRALVSSICDSVDEAPIFVQYVAFLIHQTMLQLHPEEHDLRNQVLCSFLMRRIFCPFLRDLDLLMEARAELLLGQSSANMAMGSAAEDLAAGLNTEIDLSKQVRYVFEMGAKCIEAMASCEQLRTRENWIPEVNSVIREHMSTLDNFKQDLIEFAYGYNVSLEPIPDWLDLEESLTKISFLLSHHISSLSVKMASILMNKEWLNTQQQAHQRYLEECFAYEQADPSTNVQVLHAPLVLDPKEQTALNSAIQAAQVYRKALQNISGHLSDWKMRDFQARKVYSQIDHELVSAQESNRTMLSLFGQLQCNLDQNMDLHASALSPVTRPGCEPQDPEPLQLSKSGPSTPVPSTESQRLQPLSPITGRRSRPHTPLSGSPMQARSRPHTPLSGSPASVGSRKSPAGSPCTPVQVIEAVVDSRTKLNEAISVVNSVAELYDHKVRFQRLELLVQIDPGLSTERAAEQSSAGLEAVIKECRLLSNFGTSFEAAIVIGGALLEMVGDTADVMRKVNNAVLAIEATGTESPVSTRSQPGSPQDPQTIRGRFRRASAEMASAVMSSLTPSPTPPSPRPSRSLLRDPIGLSDPTVTEAHVKGSLDLLRDAHQLWKQLVKTSPESMSRRESLRHELQDKQIEASSDEVNMIRVEISELQQQWSAKIDAGLPSIGFELCIEMLVENSTQRLEHNRLNRKLNHDMLDRLRKMHESPDICGATAEDKTAETTDGDSESDSTDELISSTDADKIVGALASLFPF